MENASKALIMVGAVLLAIIVIGFMNFTINRMGTWETAKEDEKLIEQKEKFNKEYEAYDKDLMYGVDIISCLNKAKSNNDKIEGKYAERIDEKYAVAVEFDLKTPLTESIEVFRLATSLGEGKANGETRITSGKVSINSGAYGGKNKLKDIFGVRNSLYIEKITNKSGGINWDSQNLENIENGKTTVSAKTYILDYEDKDGDNDIINALLECSSEVKKVIKNKHEEGVKDSKDGWTKAEWKTALYDLKTRRFRCTDVTYSPETGRINKISFKQF